MLLCTQVYVQIHSSENSFGATAQGKITKGTNKAQIRHGLGTGKTHFWHFLEQFRHSLQGFQIEKK